MSTSKLKNIKAVKDMLDGNHRSQTKNNVGFDDIAYVKRDVGETWYDDKGQKWEQKSGYKVKVGKLSEQRKADRLFANCNKDVCTCTDPGAADLKMKASHGMCLECVINMEHELKLKNEYDTYERKRILENARVWLKNAEVEKDVILSTIKSQFINEDGSIEDWDGLNVEQIEEQIENGFEKFKSGFMKQLEEPVNENNIT